MAKICYTIGEVADLLGENVSLVRFWSNKFPNFIKPNRNNKGNRLFSPSDVEVFKKIHYYVKERGMTLDGVQRQLSNNAEGSDKRIEVVERLKLIRAKLVEIKANL